jgi:hypothetical protein
MKITIVLVTFSKVFNKIIFALHVSAGAVGLRHFLNSLPGGNATEWFSKIICKPQRQVLIEQIKSGEIKGEKVFKELGEAMEWGDCAAQQLQSKPIQNRCFPGGSTEELEAGNFIRELLEYYRFSRILNFLYL